MQNKPSLIDLFKTSKLKDARKTMVGFGNIFWRILKNNSKGLYVYGFFDFTIRSFRVLYSGKKKFKIINPTILTFICIIFNLLWIPLILILYLPYRYFDGGRNFIKDGCCYNNVGFFGWVNIFLIIILIVLLILK